jgi:hypothetical protein
VGFLTDGRQTRGFCISEGINILGGKFSERYEGAGRWAVEVDIWPDFTKSRSWRVYETSLTIEPLATSSNDLLAC